MKQLLLNLYRDVWESLPASLQTVVCHALHVAVHTEPHVTPAAYPLAVQFNQADDMQHDIPRRSVPLAASLGGSVTEGGDELHDPSLTSLEHRSNWSAFIGWFRRNPRALFNSPGNSSHTQQVSFFHGWLGKKKQGSQSFLNLAKWRR